MPEQGHVHWPETLNAQNGVDLFPDKYRSEEPIRGGMPVRATTIPSPYHPASIREGSDRIGHDVFDASASSSSIITTESPFSTIADDENDIEALILEPVPDEYMPAALTETLELSSTDSSKRSSLGSPGIILNTTPFARSPTYTEVSGSGAFKTHRDTFALLALRSRLKSTRQHALAPLCLYPLASQVLPCNVYAHLDTIIDHETYLSLRLTSRNWSKGLTSVRPLALPAVYGLPTEVIQAIYSYLSPFDFNAARHTCQAWMSASIDKSLLIRMTCRGGWRESMNLELQKLAEKNKDDGFESAEVWLMSKILAAECILGPQRRSSSPFELALDSEFSEVDSELANAREDNLATPVRVTASVCGRFVLVMEGVTIFVYRLCQSPLRVYGNPFDPRSSYADAGAISVLSEPHSYIKSTASIQPITSIECSRPVLKVSMDTSFGRYAIAALLNNRMGMVCDILGPGTDRPSRRQSLQDDNMDSSRNEIVHTGSPHSRPITSSSPALGIQSVTPLGVSPPTNILFGDDSPALDPTIPSIKSNPAFAQSSAYAYKTGPKDVYQRIGSPHDPPSSVAICPQRRCVAFGCKSGIDLHWVDARRYDLSRWFPLTIPSDHLYFLPPRKHLDLARKLRLVSSADSEKFVSLAREEVERSRVDNWHAVPLSDGFHVLFTDPKTGNLCLGTDAPLGAPPARLRRKVFFPDPGGDKNRLPRVYAVGRDLAWGARIAVGFEDEVWLYSVPGDVVMCDGDGYWEAWRDLYASEGSGSDSVWPIFVHGVYVGSVPRLVELAVDSRLASFTVWAFGGRGAVRAFQLRGEEE